MDVCARALLVAAEMIEHGQLDKELRQRYAGWQKPWGQDVLAGKVSLQDLSDRVLSADTDVLPVSGRQENLENLVNRYL
jgi:xylose isomerase